ncbi:MAG: hypothetical protein JWP04_906 [Belnapia sp.]|nr:hypothetical protein [Belnapia sp.]
MAYRNGRARQAAAFLILLGMAGCATEAAPPPPAASVAAPATITASPAGTPFDGRYAGSFALGLSTGNSCGATFQRSMTVTDGVAAITYNRRLESTATGAVRPDGTVTLLATGNQPTRIEGRFEGNRFAGNMDSGGVRQRCHYDIEMTKRS